MRTKVELLRAIEFDKEDLSNIKNLDEVDSFSDKDKEFMEEFKKIYELGVNQLESFIKKLDEEGSELDEYSIQYYVSQLYNGPLGQYAKKLGEGKKFFKKSPDIIGNSGNNESTSSNVSLIENSPTPIGVKVDSYNKLPKFMQNTIKDSAKTVENIFRSGMRSALFMDNTLVLADKNPQLRYNTEASGEWQKKSHGSYCVKDPAFAKILEKVNKPVYAKVKELLGEEDYKILDDKKTYNPFDNSRNDSVITNFKIKRILKEGDVEEEVETDLLGDTFDSFERRKNVLKVEKEDKTVEYKLNATQGQVGFQ